MKAVSERLEHVIIENLDFEECIKKYDWEKAFFYCDPPYFYGARQPMIDFSAKDHQRLAQALSNIKGKFLLSYDDCPEARRLYKGFNIKPVSRLTGINRKIIKNPVFKEVLIANYPLKEGGHE